MVQIPRLYERCSSLIVISIISIGAHCQAFEVLSVNIYFFIFSFCCLTSCWTIFHVVTSPLSPGEGLRSLCPTTIHTLIMGGDGIFIVP